jgi:hypothetical protein
MNYWVGIAGVLILHLAITFTTIFAGTGNGSFVGLGAMLFALYGIPCTLLANFFLIRAHRTNPKKSYRVLLSVFSSLLPLMQLALLTAQIMLNL